MPNAVEFWCYCLGISALALISLFFGFYGAECALIGWALSQMDIGDLNQLYLKPAKESADAEQPVGEKIAAGLALPDPRGTVVPFPLKRNRTHLGTRKRAARAKTL